MSLITTQTARNRQFKFVFYFYSNFIRRFGTLCSFCGNKIASNSFYCNNSPKNFSDMKTEITFNDGYYFEIFHISSTFQRNKMSDKFQASAFRNDKALIV